MTWSVSDGEVPTGRTTRRLSGSVNPPVPSPMASEVVVVCWKSGLLEYRIRVCRPRSSWFRTRVSRAYHRSAILADCSATALNSG